MSMPSQIEETDCDAIKSPNRQQIRLWTQLPIMKQRQLARHWARLTQQIRCPRPKKEMETSTHGT